MTDTAAISLHGVTVQAGTKRILHDVSLDIAAGSRVAVLGPSGSGKTTLLRALAGLADGIAAGRIALDGRVVTEAGGRCVPPHERGIAMVFQDLALWPHMSVLGHLRFAAAAPRGRDQIVRETLGAVGLFDRERSRPADLSGGERQRLALARALVTRPRLLLLDEPFSSLDLPLRQEMIDLVLSLHRASQATLVHVTHDPVEAALMAERLVCLDQGRVVFDGAVADAISGAVPPLGGLSAALARWRQVLA